MMIRVNNDTWTNADKVLDVILRNGDELWLHWSEDQSLMVWPEYADDAARALGLGRDWRGDGTVAPLKKCEDCEWYRFVTGDKDAWSTGLCELNSPMSAISSNPEHGATADIPVVFSDSVCKDWTRRPKPAEPTDSEDNR